MEYEVEIKFEKIDESDLNDFESDIMDLENKYGIKIDIGVYHELWD